MTVWILDAYFSRIVLNAMKEFFCPEPHKFALLGSGNKLPPNSPISFADAIEKGADVISIGLRLTSDREVIVIWDEDLASQSNGTGKAGQLTLKEVKNLDAAYKFCVDGEYKFRDKGIQFMTFDEMLDMFPQQRFHIEILDRGIESVKAFCRIVKNRDASGRILLSCYNKKIIQMARLEFPEMATSLSFYELIGMYALFRTGLLFLKKSFQGDAIISTETIGTSYVANQGLILSAKEKGLRVYIRNVLNDHQALRLIDSGADGIISESMELLAPLAF